MGLVRTISDSDLSKARKHCDVCFREYSARGITAHRKACIIRRDVMLAARRHKQNTRAVHQSNTVRLRRNNEDLDSEALPVHTFTPRPIPHVINKAQISPPIESTNEYAVVNPEIGPSGADRQGTSSDSLDNDDYIRTVYHPKSGRDPTIVSLSDLSGDTNNEECSDDGKSSSFPNSDNPPFYPFHSMADFCFAHAVIRQNMTNEAIDEHLRIHQMRAPPVVSFKNHRDIFKILAEARKLLTDFKMVEIELFYKKKPECYKVIVKSPLGWIDESLRNPSIAKNIEWDAMKKFKRVKGKWIRFIDQPWTADDMWKAWDKIKTSPPNDNISNFPLAILIYSDKAKLGQFSSTKSYPVIARLCILPNSIRNTSQIGGACVIGWLPVPVEMAKHHGPNWATFKDHLWHRAMDVILESLAEVRDTGFIVACGDGVTRRIFPFIFDLVGDYEEQATMTLTRGSTALFPCPCCLVPHHLLHDLCHSSPARTAVDSKKLYVSARHKNNSEKEEILKPVGLRFVQNTFWKLGARSDPHQRAAYDELHAFSSGVFGGHLWPLITAVIVALGRNARETVDSRIANLPSWPGLCTFETCVSVHFSDGKQYDALLKTILLAIHDLGDKVYNLMRVLRSLCLIRILCSLEVHTEETLEWGEVEVCRLNEFAKAKLISDDLAHSIQANKTKTVTMNEDLQKVFDFLKWHMLSHMFPDIRRKGASLHHSTRPNESVHRPLRSVYLKSNKRNVGVTITDHEQYRMVLNEINDTIQNDTKHREDEKLLNTKEESERENKRKETLSADQTKAVPVNPSTHFDRIELGSPVGKQTTVQSIELFHSADPSFKNFLARYQSFLTGALGNPPPTHAETVMEFRQVKVFYDSRVDWRLHHDILRCNPDFHGKPRYDSVIVDTDAGPTFARLLFMLKTCIFGKSYNVAFLRYYQTAGDLRITAGDKLTGFKRVTLSPPRDAQFIFLESVIRGAYICPTQDIRENEFFIHDLIDGDMYIRLRQDQI